MSSPPPKLATLLAETTKAKAMALKNENGGGIQNKSVLCPNLQALWPAYGDGQFGGGGVTVINLKNNITLTNANYHAALKNAKRLMPNVTLRTEGLSAS